MKIYLVGGAVRDTLLGRQIKDKDFVVVGATPQQMIDMGFEQVGSSFPVFLKNGEEYALARTERKTGVGYNGFETTFDPSVTLSDDLLRRDLTINSMAQDLETGEIIDPFNGCDDLSRGILRHTSSAFAEDPVRVLRTARFAARYGFSVDLTTHQLMSKVVPELDHVPQERIWAEFAKGLMEDNPEQMIAVLLGVGAFEVDAMRSYKNASPTKMMIAKQLSDLAARFATIASNFSDEDYERCRIPTECAKLSRVVNKFGRQLLNMHNISADGRLEILTKLRVVTNEKFIWEAINTSAMLFGDETFSPSADRILKDIQALQSIDVGKIVSTCRSGEEIKNTLFKARIAVMEG